ncbi:MAG: RluA family pseudouridine synthase [Betaproteobacteria bacterium]|nr:RluA family pseudouridine synthase [Betaproteobacteria bacterium]
MHSSPSPANVIAVDEAGAGQRLDNFLARHLKGVPRSHIYRIVRSGEVRVNGSRAQASRKLALDDRVRVPPVAVAAPAPSAPPRNYRVLFEDDWLLAVDKPAGVAVHGGSGLSWGLIESLRSARDDRFLELVHRLDRDTSGVLLLARRRSALTALHASLRRREADKRYLVLVAGLWQGDGVSVNTSLLRYLTSSGERRVRVVDAGQGQEARSQFRPLRRFPWPDAELARRTGVPGLTLVEARIHTGRTHQIRVHLHSLGYPVAGDEKYGLESLNRALAQGDLPPGLPRNARMFLHAAHLRLRHPADERELVLQADWPAADEQWLQQLGQACGSAR